MVDSGNITGPNIDTYYSSVVSLRSIFTVLFISELNNIETGTGDTSNSYLTIRTDDKIVFNAGP